MSKMILGNLLEFETFNPKTMDVSYIQELSNSIPKDGHVDYAMADKLALKFLRGADMCSELIGKLSWWAAKKKDESKKALQEAALITAPSKGFKTASEKKLYAEGDAQYQLASDALNKAEAMLLWVKNKYSSLVSAHYMMKHIAKGSESHQQASNVLVGGGPTQSHGEQSW